MGVRLHQRQASREDVCVPAACSVGLDDLRHSRASERRYLYACTSWEAGKFMSRHKLDKDLYLYLSTGIFPEFELLKAQMLYTDRMQSTQRRL